MKKVIVFILVCCMSLSLITGIPMVAGAAASGTCGDNLTWTLDDNGTLTISGTGEMYDYRISPWWKNDGISGPAINSVVIEEGVTSIGKSAIEIRTMQYIQIPSSVEKINSKFLNCYNLTNINVSIDNKNYCSENGILYNKNKDTLIIYPAGKPDKNFSVPDRVSIIRQHAFVSCQLEEIQLPKGFQYTGDFYFDDKEVYESFCGDVFTGCLNLKNIEIDESSSKYCSDNGILYDKNKTKLIKYPAGKTAEYFIVPSTVTTLDTDAFEDSQYLIGITIPNSVTCIEEECLSIGNITDIYYEGSESDWNKLSVTIFSDGPNEATIHFNSEEIDSPNSTEKPILPNVPNEDTNSDKKLTKMALCKAVYNNLKVEKNSDNLLKTKTIKDEAMFYDEYGNWVASWKNDFIIPYAGNMKVIKTLTEKESGFYGAAFQDGQGNIIIAYRGTNNWTDWSSTNIPMLANAGLSVQFEKALELYDTVKEEYPNADIELTGHSLGGALASYVAIIREVRTDNVNGATGLIFGNCVKTDPELLIDFKGIDAYVNEMYNEESGILNSNVYVTMFNRGHFFNSSLYRTPELYNSYDFDYDNPKGKYDYHAISSIIGYQDNKFYFTPKTKTYILDQDFAKFGNTIIGTTYDNVFSADITESKFYVDERTGVAVSPTSFQQLTEIQNNPYMIPGMPDNSNKIVLCGDGNDSVRIYGGNDTIVGGAGNDTLNGGTGNDTYYFGENWGNDTITDITGNDMLIFTDTPMSEISAEKTPEYILLTAGSNSVKILKKGRQIKSASMKIKASGEVSGDIFTTELLNENNISAFSLRTSAVNENTAKQLYISGVATLEVYDTEGNLLETVRNTETQYISGDYGAITLFSEDEHPFIEGIFTENDYNFVITSDEKVTCSISMNADSQNINNLSVISTDIPVGAKMETSTIPNTEGKAEFRIVYEDESSETVENIYLQSVESLVVMTERDVIYAGEEISLAAMILPQDALVQATEWTWESKDGVVEIIQDIDGNITLTGAKAGIITVRATASDGSGVYGEATVLVQSDPAPSVKMTAGDMPYMSGETATSPVKIEVGTVDGYETVVEANCELDIEDNCYTIASNGDFDITIYGKNFITNAVTKKVRINVVQTVHSVDVSIVATNGTVTGAGTYVKGSNVVISATANSGYSFSGWYIGEDLISTDGIYTFIADSNTVLIAKFSKISGGGGGGGGGTSTYSINFETNGGEAIPKQSVKKNNTVVKPDNPEREGYIFAGWYTDKEFINTYDFSSKVTKDLTLYAKWDEIPKSQLILTIGEKEALANGEVKANDVAPIIVNDRTMLPARFIAETLGANVEWNEAERKVTITKDEIKIIIYIDSDVAFVNDEKVTLDSPAFIENDRTYTPVRFIAEALGATVDWNEGEQKVTILY